MSRVRDGANLPRFTVQRVGHGTQAHARIFMNGHRLEGVTVVKVEQLAAGLNAVELTILSSHVTILPDASE